MTISRFIAISLLTAFSLVVSLALLPLRPADHASLVVNQFDVASY